MPLKVPTGSTPLLSTKVPTTVPAGIDAPSVTTTGVAESTSAEVVMVTVVVSQVTAARVVVLDRHT